MNFAKQRCNAIQVSYLESSYENLIYLLTTNTSEAYSIILNPEDLYLNLIYVHDNLNGCNSLHDQLVGRQCEPVYNEHRGELGSWKKGNGSIETDERMERVCRKVMDCVEKYCIFNSNLKNRGIGSCQPLSPTNYTKLPFPTHPPAPPKSSKTFDECYADIATTSSASHYACVDRKRILSQSNFLNALVFNAYSPTYYLSGVLTNKQCVKTLMKGECEAIAVENFDKDWNRIRRDTVAMKRRLRNDTAS